MGSGYKIGPTLPTSEPPWPSMWEQDPSIDGCTHSWEAVLLAPGKGRYRMDEVVRCEHCHAPRCGHVHDSDPCMDRRHHRGPHLLFSGSLREVGA